MHTAADSANGDNSHDGDLVCTFTDEISAREGHPGQGVGGPLLVPALESSACQIPE